MGADHVLHDGEAKPRALAIPRQPVVDPVELLEDPGVLALLEPLPVVLDHEAHLAGLGPDDQLDLWRISAVLDGVGQEVQERVTKGGAIGIDEDVFFGQVHAKLCPASVENGGKGRGGLGHHISHAGDLDAELFAPTLHAAPVEQSIDQLLQPHALPGQALDALVLRLEVTSAQRQSLGEQSN